MPIRKKPADTAPSASGTSDKPEKTEPKAGEKITLRVLAGQSTTDAGIEDMIDEALAEKYPNITLEWECVDWGKDFQPKMQQYLQSGLPDIMIGKAQDIATYGSQGVLADLTGKDYLSNILDAAIPVSHWMERFTALYTTLCTRVYTTTESCLRKTTLIFPLPMKNFRL